MTDDGTFDISGASTGVSIASLAGSGTVVLGSNTLTLTTGSGAVSVGIAGSGGLAVAGGTKTLTGTNTYTGATTIDSGATLALAGTGSIAASAVTDDGTLDISGTTNGTSIAGLAGSGAVALGSQTLTLTNAAETFSGVVAGSGGLTIAGGTETLTGANTYTGATAISTGATLALSGAGSIASSAVADNGTLDIAGTSNGTSIVSLGGSGSVTLGSKTLTLTGASGIFSGVIAGSGGLAVAGGTEALTGANTYSGGTTVGGSGTLSVGNNSALGTGSVAMAAGATLQSGAAGIDLSNDVALAGKDTIDTQSNTMTLSGIVSGSGGLTKTGSGTLVLAGANSYAGGTTVSAGTLQGDSTSLRGDIADNASLVFDQGSSGSYAGSLSGNGTVEKQNTGTLIFDGNSAAFAGSTVVAAGTLEIGDAAHATAALGGNVSVMANATLQGHGRISGSVTNNGDVRPGGSIGVLTVGGNYTQTAAGTFGVELSPTVGSELVVGGRATVAGKLELIVDPGTYRPGTEFTILTAGKGLSGEFSTTTEIGGQGDVFKTIYTADSIELLLEGMGTGTGFLFSPQATTPNGLSIARILDAANAIGLSSQAFAGLIADVKDVPLAWQERAFEALGGEIYADLDTLMRDNTRALMGDIAIQLRSASPGPEDPNAAGFFWGHATARFSSLDGSGGTHEVVDNVAGFVAGYQTARMDDSTLGVAIDYAHDAASTNGLPQQAHLDSFAIAGYGEQRWGPIFADAAVSAGYGHGTVDRTLNATGYAGQASGEVDAFDLGGMARAGYHFDVQSYAFEPYAGLIYNFGQQAAVDETSGGAAALHVDGKDRQALQSAIGLKTATSYALGSGVLKPEIQVAWTHELTPQSPHLEAYFQAFPQQFAISGASMDRDAASVNLRLNYATGTDTTLYVAYDGTYSGLQTVNAISGGLTVHW